jgi:hypothetical protein
MVQHLRRDSAVTTAEAAAPGPLVGRLRPSSLHRG